MLYLNSHVVKLFLLACVVGLIPTTAVAQRVRAETELLREQEVREEIGLEGEKAEQMEELLKNTRPGKEFFEPFLKRIGETKDRDEQSKIRQEMTTAIEQKSQEMKEAALEILTDLQKRKLRSIYLRSAGINAFSDARIAKQYDVSEDQLKALADVASAQRDARRSLSAEATDEDRDRQQQEFQQKFLNVLSAEQKQRYLTESAFGSDTAVAENADGATGIGSAAETPGAMSGPPEGEQAVGSFGGGEPGENKRVDEFRFNFRYETWERVLQMFADGAGLTLDLNQLPPGTFSHYDDKAYTARQTLDILNSYLQRKGYAMIENNGFLIVMNTDNGIPPYLIRNVTEEELLKIGKELEVGDHELATFRISLEGMDTAKVAQEVEALLGPLGSLVALTDSQLLIITDVGASLRRIHALLTAAMSRSKPDALMFKAYHLTNMDAEEAELAVMTQFGMRQNVANVSVASEAANRSRSRSRSSTPTPTPPPAAAKTESTVQIASDLRLNSLLVTGTARQHELVETIITALDVSETPNGNPLTRGRKGTYLEVYQVKSADAGEVTKTLAAMNIPGVQVVNEDRRTGRVHIMATERQHEEVAALIRQLDGGGTSGSVDVIALAQMDPLSAAATLRSLFYADGEDAPTIEADLYGRRLIVRGSVEQITQIRQVLADLGEDGTGVRERGEGGLVRRFSLQGRSPEQFLNVLQQQWDSQQETKINIVVPRELNPIRSLRTPEEEISQPSELPPLIDPGTPSSNESGAGGTDAQASEKAQPTSPADNPATSGPLSSRLKSVTPGRWNAWRKPEQFAADRARRADAAAQPLNENVASIRLETAAVAAAREQAAAQSSDQTAVVANQYSSAARQTLAKAPVQPPSDEQQSDSEPSAASDQKQPSGQKPPWDPSNRSSGSQNENGGQPVTDDVYVQLIGDELILSSQDQAKLDELEELLEMLHQTLPMKPEYTVVYLEAADALEAADMLSQFFPSSSVASVSATSSGSMFGSLGSSFGSMGSSLMDATGLSGLGSSTGLKIIPDVRTNSLFLTGPQSMIRDALAFLRVLDSNDVPESLKDMQPRQILVQYADVNAVASLVRDVFKPYMEAAGGGRQQQQNPLAAMFGGGGGSSGRGKNDDSKVRMTIGVDEQTSTLTINSNQEIFDAVEKVVTQSDEAARSANPTVRSIQLKNADAVVIQQMLGSLVPRVSVSSSKTASAKPAASETSGSGGGNSSGGRDRDQGQEALSREIQNRIRERMQQQQSSGGQSGRGGFNPFGGGSTRGRGNSGRGGR